MVAEDPLLHLIPQERPQAFAALSPAERRVRARYFLMAWAYCGRETYAWFLALQQGPEASRAIHELVASVPDVRIAEAIGWREHGRG